MLEENRTEVSTQEFKIVCRRDNHGARAARCYHHCDGVAKVITVKHEKHGVSFLETVVRVMSCSHKEDVEYRLVDIADGLDGKAVVLVVENLERSHWVRLYTDKPTGTASSEHIRHIARQKVEAS